MMLLASAMCSPQLFLRRHREEQSGTCLGARRMSISTSAFGLAAHTHRRSSRKAIPNHVFGSAVACLVLGCAWTLHANVFGASVYPQLSSANFGAPVIRPAAIAVRSALSPTDTIVAALPSTPASMPSRPLLSFDD